MYCQTCNCDYGGWTNRCPVCKSQLQERKREPAISASEAISYAELVEKVRQQNGRLEIDLTTTQVRKKKKQGFPYRGYGFAWAGELHGEWDGLEVELFTTRVEEDQAWSFPYFGYGFAWEQELEGQVQGQPLALLARKVNRKRQQGFPYRGHGFAWTEDLEGACGAQLEASFSTTRVERSRGYLFPFFGYGYAWIAEGKLSLRLLEEPAV